MKCGVRSDDTRLRLFQRRGSSNTDSKNEKRGEESGEEDRKDRRNSVDYNSDSDRETRLGPGMLPLRGYNAGNRAKEFLRVQAYLYR